MTQKKIEFWMSFNNGAEKFQLPVNPPVIEIESTHGYEDVDVNDLGEYTIIKGAKLKTFSFSSFFPRDYNPTYCNTTTIYDPWWYAQGLIRWRESNRPMRLVVTNTPMNFACTLRDFKILPEQAGHPGDIFFEASFKEFSFINFRTIDLSTTSTSSDASDDRPDNRDQAGTYTVKKGDSLWKIAQSELGSGSKFQSIADKNGIKKPYIIQPGQVLKL